METIPLDKKCPECGSQLKIVKHFEGSFFKKALDRYKCTNSACPYEETRESSKTIKSYLTQPNLRSYEQTQKDKDIANNPFYGARE